MKFELKKGSVYTSTGVKEFLEPVINSLKITFPTADILVRGNSSFAVLDLYDLCEEKGLHYLIKLKVNSYLHQLASVTTSQFLEHYKLDYSKYHEHFDDFQSQAVGLIKRRVICKVERAARELVPRTTYIVTSLSLDSMIL